MKRRVRSGFSLMEVMLATSILLGSSIVLVELATIGRKQAMAAYDLNIAQLLCQAKIDEIVTGIAPATAVEQTEIEGEPDWLYSVETIPIVDRNLTGLKVTVSQVTDENHKPVRFSLVRWLQNPPSDIPGRAPEPSPSSASPAAARDAISPIRGAGQSVNQPRMPREPSRERRP